MKFKGLVIETNEHIIGFKAVLEDGRVFIFDDLGSYEVYPNSIEEVD